MHNTGSFSAPQPQVVDPLDTAITSVAHETDHAAQQVTVINGWSSWLHDLVAPPPRQSRSAAVFRETLSDDRVPFPWFAWWDTRWSSPSRLVIDQQEAANEGLSRQPGSLVRWYNFLKFKDYILNA